MHDDHVLFRPGKNSVVNAIGVFHLLPLFVTREPLFLDAGNVEHVGVGKYLVEGLADRDRDACLACGSDDARRHGEGRRRDEVEAYRVQAEQSDQAVHCSAVLQVTE